jgi:perosamine synthetase
MQRIHCAGPSITEREIAYVTDAVTNCWYGDAGKYHDRFEQAAADYVGTKHALSTPTGTSAIHLSLWALGVGPGDEVIVPELTWIGSAAPAHYLGATPIFADIDPETLCLCADSFAACITPRTKAVVVVDLYGAMPDYARLRMIAAQHNVAIVEDAAQAFGSALGGRRAGSFGATGIFSLHGSKTITTGEGGLLLTDDDALHARALSLRDHGRQITSERFDGELDRYYRHEEIGTKYRMTAMQAALGLAQIERADELVAAKRRIFDWYAEDLADARGLTLMRPRAEVVSSYWLPTAMIDPELGVQKHHIAQALERRNIDARPVYYPLSSQPVYQDTPPGRRAAARNTNAYRVSPYAINLPSNLRMDRDHVALVSAAVKQSLEQPVVSH